MDKTVIQFVAEIDEVKVKNLVSGDKEIIIKIKTPDDKALLLHQFISNEAVNVKVEQL